MAAPPSPSPSNRTAWWYAAVALTAAFLFALLTPPMQSPDEVAHYWRACAVARGQLMPHKVDGKPSAMIPADARDLVFHTWMEMAGKDIRYERDRFARAWTLRPSSETVQLSFPAFYTFVPYVPQAAAIALTRLFKAPTLVSFYAGRIANALAGVLLVVLAMRLAPAAGWIFAAVGLTPMFLYLCGSYSADVVTAGAAFCTAAAGLRASVKPLALFSFILTLAKPAYFLIAVASAVRRAAVLALIVLGVVIAAWTTRSAYYPMRPDVVTDAPQQLEQVTRAPHRFAALAVTDYANNADQYYEHFVGRLGWLDIGLPRFVRWMFGLLFLYVAGATAMQLTAPQRLLLVAAFAATLLIVSLSQYLIWTAVGANEVHGIQGRYFLPVAPLLLLACSRRVWPLHVAVPLGIGAIANVVAIATLSRHYYGTLPLL